MAAVEQSIGEKAELDAYILRYTTKNERLKINQQSLLDQEALRQEVCYKLQLVQDLFVKNRNELCDFFVKYVPSKHSQINLKKIVSEAIDEIRLIKNVKKIYFGGVNAYQKRHGPGILIDDKGKIYEGAFNNGVKEGHGMELYSNGNAYLGDFENNKKHGPGQFYWFSLSPPAKDTAKFVEFYSGGWWGGLPDGKGSHQKANGDVYDGEFKNGLKHGTGEQYFSNGDSYKGEYVNGQPEGLGLYIWRDHSSYKGQFKQGLRNGQGTWISENHSEEYKGQYVLDKKCGFGEYVWQNRHYLYKGNFQDDLRHGEGELYFEGALEYKGEWIYGKIAGQHQLSGKQHDTFKNTISYAHTSNRDRFPSLVKPKAPASAIVRRIKTNQFSSGNKHNLSGSKSKSPTGQKLRSRPQTYSKNHLHNLIKETKTFVIAKSFSRIPPLAANDNKITIRPLSTTHERRKSIRKKAPQLQLFVKRCDRINCGCNLSIPLRKKSGKKKEQHYHWHAKTEDFRF